MSEFLQGMDRRINALATGNNLDCLGSSNRCSCSRSLRGDSAVAPKFFVIMLLGCPVDFLLGTFAGESFVVGSARIIRRGFI